MSMFSNAAKLAVNPIGTANSWLYGNMPDEVKWAIPGYAEQQNYGQQKNVFEWQKSVQETNWQREDNAVQRRVADLKSAGLSPVLAAGSAAQSGPPVSVTAPQRQRTPAIETAAQVMAMMRQKVDISRTEAETDAIMAQAEKTRIQTMIESEKAKTIGSIISSQLGLTTANTSAARAAAALSRVEEEAKRYDYEGSRRTGTAVQASSFGRFYRDLFIDFIKPNSGTNRAGQTFIEPNSGTNRAGQTSSW